MSDGSGENMSRAKVKERRFRSIQNNEGVGGSDSKKSSLKDNARSPGYISKIYVSGAGRKTTKKEIHDQSYLERHNM